MIRIPVFRIFYSTTFSVLLLLTLALLAVTPGDAIFQSYKDGQRFNIIIIAGVYLLVLIASLFIYATRLYTTRTYLAAIPKSRLPLQNGDLPRRARRLVLAGIERSAGVAFRAKPRDLTEEFKRDDDNDDNDDKAEAEKNDTAQKASRQPLPTWGEISHPGWSAPHDPEMPNMHYTLLLQELPHLLEARAVSLAPIESSDGSFPPTNAPVDVETQHRPDPEAVMLLQRPRASSLRAYISQLVDLGVLQNTDLVVDFLSRYEEARFSARPLREKDFRFLVDLFANILDVMQEPSQKALDDASSMAETESISMANIRNREEIRNTFGQTSGSEARPKYSRNFSSGRLAPPPLDLSRRRVRSTSLESRGSTHSDASYATPAHSSTTPYFTPYPEPLSARTASTGSLAGSEGTAETAPSRFLGRSLRTPSAYSHRSSRPLTGRRRSSKSARGLGLEVQDGDHHQEGHQADRTDGNDMDSRSHGISQLGDGEDGSLEDGGSVRKYSIGTGEGSPSEDAHLSLVESMDSEGSVVRRTKR